MITVVLSLIQDIAVIAPVLRRAAGRDVAALVHRRLAAVPAARDRLAALTAGHDRVLLFESTAGGLHALADRRGLVIFPSESRSPHHRPTHALAAALPSRFVSVTLQHGYECVGFLHNRAHDRTREDAGFAADIVCGWLAADRLTAVPFADRAKVMTTGATLFLDDEPADWLDAVVAGEPAPSRARSDALLVCENLASVRLAGAPKAAFLDALHAVARERPVTLRPHPAGPFAKGELAPPPNVTLDARPIEDAELGRYRAAISPPSTVLFDLIRHDVPVALWRDPHGIIDDRLYGDLPRVGPPKTWLAFHEAAEDPAILDAQRGFIRRLGFPADTRARFDALFALADDL
ncbi:hypothetical protein L1787_05700 [Acuticoccus sp. M5D2P5]|uniref:hypothetical protein n=1 Tax=Acuticoccus kalidii TaxID=2910977 RepID=UPI001F1EEB97|nr:hypothetical protein [Acuticoccus kalidii]MCF3932907.1 hypothetical protein [Acuticoccus kalidii]